MNDISRQILSTFKKGFDKLTWVKKRHFSARAMLVSHDPYWKKQLAIGLDITERETEKLLTYSDEEKLTYGKMQLDTTRYKLKPNDVLKVEYLVDKPEVLYWSDLLVHLRYLNRYRSLPVRDWIEANRIEQLFEQVISRQALRSITAIAIELATDLEDLFGLEVHKKQADVFRKTFLETRDEAEWWNYVYGLTHFIIGRSRHYRKKVERDFWAVTKLVELYPKIERSMGLDGQAEVVVALKISDADAAIDFDSFHGKVESEIDEISGRILFGNIINDSEHVNIMVILALVEMERL